MKFIALLFNYILLFFQIDIDKKLKEAPNDSYQIGIVIGTYLPLILLFALAYYMYYRAKKKHQD
jgi:hypothetical protein